MSIAHHEAADGVTCIDVDLVRPNLACCYLLREGDHYAFIDTGVASAVPGMLDLLALRGIAREQVDYVIPTHVHLDHAGGSGALMKALPRAQLVVHPRGARHLIDPAALIAGSIEVYGEQGFRRMYGEIEPVEESRMIIAGDGHRLMLGGRELLILDAPGHARHHFVVWDEKLQGFFTGDTFGISYRQFDRQGHAFLFPTTTPVQFEPDPWRETIARMRSLRPQQMFLTHFGRVGEVEALAEDLLEGIGEYVTITQRFGEQGKAVLSDRLMDYSLAKLRQKGLMREDAEALLRFDMDLNAQGLGVWLQRQRRPRPAAGASSSAH
jgi:glyoxylase-like metal-dependent hydrolase (beta-lactamase superfamily II)